jgi:hypothetical protein
MTIVRDDGIVPGIRLIQPIKFKIYSISYCMDYYAMKTGQNSCSFSFDFVCFNVAIVLSVLLRYTDSDYPFGIFKLFFE